MEELQLKSISPYPSLGRDHAAQHTYARNVYEEVALGVEKELVIKHAEKASDFLKYEHLAVDSFSS